LKRSSLEKQKLPTAGSRVKVLNDSTRNEKKRTMPKRPHMAIPLKHFLYHHEKVRSYLTNPRRTSTNLPILLKLEEKPITLSQKSRLISSKDLLLIKPSIPLCMVPEPARLVVVLLQQRHSYLKRLWTLSRKLEPKDVMSMLPTFRK
jgi:hypothetical protein